MQAIIGFIIVLVMVFGGYAAAGGSFIVILHALPFEMTMIAGASIGAFIVASNGVILKGTIKALATAFKGSKWKKQNYQDLLCLLFDITKVMKTKGMLSLESHIEKPEESEIFCKYPILLKDHFTRDLICDSLRLMIMGFNNPYQLENSIQNQLDKHHSEANAIASSLQTVSDGLPAIGIVAAVLGVIKTMASVTEPPEILGKMIAGALTGTFLGVFLSYCFVGPLASKISNIIEEEAQFYYIIRDILISNLQGNAPQISIEIGRGNVPSHYQPTFFELEAAINNTGEAATPGS